jgi:hypothetical protein
MATTTVYEASRSACVPLQLHIVFINQASTLVASEFHDVVVTTMIRVNKTARLKGNIWKCAGGRCLTAGGKCESDFFLWPQYSHDTADRLTQYSLQTLFVHVPLLIGHILTSHSTAGYTVVTL